MMHLDSKEVQLEGLLKLWVYNILLCLHYLNDKLHKIICSCSGKSINWNEFEIKLKKLQNKSIKHITNVSNSYNLWENISKTDDHFKYEIVRQNIQTYKPPVVIAKLLAVVDVNGNIVTEPDIKKHGTMVSLVMDKTCFYCKAGGQQNDLGVVKTNKGKIFEVIGVENIQENGIILHHIKSNDWPILLR